MKRIEEKIARAKKQNLNKIIYNKFNIFVLLLKYINL